MDAKQVVKAFHKALASKNFDTLWSVMTKDSKFILNDEVFTGHDEIKESFEGFWDLVPDVDYGTAKVFVAADNRVVSTFTVSGTKVHVNGRTCRGKWQFNVAALATVRGDKMLVWHEFLDPSSLNTAISTCASKE
jgi:limonene-1,2-epoxide hydrolase